MDKLLHLIVSYVVVFILNKKVSLITSVVITILFGVFKELFDYMRYGLFNLHDIMFNLIGILIFTISITFKK